ncbi:MAG: hypothetical protein DHS20C18_15080 [Saprospiraceae bacterium]|nr:MAG: hypothetical protein DHS20C18_15080 [Saprospiraceae bacterium]
MNSKKLSYIKKTASLKNTLLLALLFLIMSLFIMPEATKQIKQYSHETGLIDKLLYYPPSKVYAMLSAYGERGRNLYLVVELTADMVFSIVIAAFLGFLLIWSSLKSRNFSIKMKYLLWLPVALLLANWLENGGIIWMLINFPEQYFFLALVTSFFTLSKWILILICGGIAGWNLVKLSTSLTSRT